MVWSHVTCHQINRVMIYIRLVFLFSDIAVVFLDNRWRGVAAAADGAGGSFLDALPFAHPARPGLRRNQPELHFAAAGDAAAGPAVHPQREPVGARQPGARVVRFGVPGTRHPRPQAGHLGARLQGRRRLRGPEGRLLVRAQRRARQD